MTKPPPRPRIRDAYPLHAQYAPGEAVIIEIILYNPLPSAVEAEVIVHTATLGETRAAHAGSVKLKPRAAATLNVAADAKAERPGGYGVDISLLCGGSEVDTRSTAYDVAVRWCDAPRYGFLTGFGPGDEGDRADVEELRKYHINAVQFYDWMYRHHDLMPPQDRFADPLGREMSLQAVRGKISACHALGMRAMAYGAVYAASREFAAAHPDMMLMKNDGEQELFGDSWQNIMDVSEGSGWDGHITGEYARAVREMGFDGVQMDTYGYPKTAFGAGGRFVRLRREHARLVDNAKKALQAVRADAAVFFNAVGNWPAAEVARSGSDASYIEVWPPYERYIHLRDIIRDARREGSKPVILAAYLSAFRSGPAAPAERALLLAQAAIFASGGYHIALGERNGVLCDPYFVNHAALRPAFVRTLRRWYDFITRYRDLLYDGALEDITMTHAGGLNEDYVFSGSAFSCEGEPGKVWTIVKEKPGAKVIHLINLTGIRSDRWNEGKPAPKAVQGIKVRVLDNERARAVWLASPDSNCCRMEPLPFEALSTGRGRAVTFAVPDLRYWDMIYIETEY